MMASSELSTRLRYLNESAHLLAATAPETSRHLMLRCNTLLLENDIPLPEPQSRKACSACGTIMILGWKGTLKTESQRPRQKNDARNPKPITQARTMVYECKICDRKTRQTLQAPSSRHKSASIINKGASVIPSQAPNLQPNTRSTNSSSRKRKKSKNSGLEALLAKQKASQASFIGLDLMDLMKKA